MRLLIAGFITATMMGALSSARAQERGGLEVVVKVFFIRGADNISPKTNYAFRFQVLPKDEDRTCKVTITSKYYDKDGTEIANSEKKYETSIVLKAGEIIGASSTLKPKPTTDAPGNTKGVLSTIKVEASTTSQKTGSAGAIAAAGTKDRDPQLNDPKGKLTITLNHAKFSYALAGFGNLHIDWEIIVKAEKDGKLFNSPIHGTFDLAFTLKDDSDKVVDTEYYSFNADGGTGVIQTHTYRAVGQGTPLPNVPTSYTLGLLDKDSGKTVKSGTVKLTILVTDDSGENQGYLQTERDIQVRK